MAQLAGRCAVVTGAASGIGKSMATRLAKEGMRVALADVEADPVEAVAAELRAGGAEAMAVPTDVSSIEQVTALQTAVSDAFGSVHVLCNNAGVGGGGPIAQLTTHDWQWVLGVNLWGVINGLTAFLPSMLSSGEPGHIVNTASMAGLVAPPMMGPYTASKFAVVALSETLHHEMTLSNSAIKVSVLCPGWVSTRIYESARNRPDELGGRQHVNDATSLAAQIIKSGMDPDDVADHVVKAVREERFWVLTHPEMAGGIETRMRSILEQTNPQLNVSFFTGTQSPTN